MLVNELERGRSVTGRESHSDERRPLAFRVGRYSSRDGDRQLERQEADTLALVLANDYEDGGWFGVDDESGNVDTRRRQGKADTPSTIRWAMEQISSAKDRWPERPVVLVAWKDSRLWRDVSEKEAVRRFLRQWDDATWHTYEGQKNPHSATDTLVSTVTAGGNQFYSDSVRELVKAAHNDRLKDRKPVTGWPGFGHRKDGDYWRVHDEEAALVRDAIHRILNGTPMATVVKEWTEADVGTRLGGKWTITTLRRVLTAPRLAGILVHRGVEVGPTPYIEAIVDESTLRRMQSTGTKRKNVRQRVGMQLLTGVLVCGLCDTPLNSNLKGSKKPTRVYSCRGCFKVNINSEAVDGVVTDLLFRRLHELDAAQYVNANDNSKALLRELAALDGEEAELEEAAADLPVKVLKAKAQAINERRKVLTQQLSESQQMEDAAQWFAQAKKVTKGWKSLETDEQRQIIVDVLGRFAVAPGGAGHPATPDRVIARLTPLA